MWLKHSRKSLCETCGKEGNTREFFMTAVTRKRLRAPRCCQSTPSVSEVINGFLFLYHGWKAIKRNNQDTFLPWFLSPRNTNTHKSLQMFSLEFKSNIAKFMVPTPTFSSGVWCNHTVCIFNLKVGAQLTYTSFGICLDAAKNLSRCKNCHCFWEIYTKIFFCIFVL